MNLLIYVFMFIAGFLTYHYIPKPSVKQDKQVVTETKIVTKTLPAKIVYKDKVREIHVRCPSVGSELSSAESESSSVKTSYFSPMLKLSVSQNINQIKDVNQVKIGLGYFLNKNISLDLQTNIKLDIIEVGTSLYF